MSPGQAHVAAGKQLLAEGSVVEYVPLCATLRPWTSYKYVTHCSAYLIELVAAICAAKRVQVLACTAMQGLSTTCKCVLHVLQQQAKHMLTCCDSSMAVCELGTCTSCDSAGTVPDRRVYGDHFLACLSS